MKSTHRGTAGPEPAPGPAALVPRPEPAIATRPVAAATPAPTPAAEVAAGAYQPASVRSLLAGNEPNGCYDQDRDTYIYDTGRPIVLTLSDGTHITFQSFTGLTLGNFL